MIIVKIIGGLGNQMFQYAYAKALEKQGHEVKLDTTAFKKYKLHGGYQLGKYHIDIESSTVRENKRYYREDYIYKVFVKLGLIAPKKRMEESLLFNETLLDISDNTYVEGYFQSEKYFLTLREDIIKSFTIISDISSYTQTIKKEILSETNSVSLHIRRGDYVTNKTTNNIHGTCDIAYYKNAMLKVEKSMSDMKYFIFSDDISWVKENLQISNALYIDSKEERIPHEDIYLMSLCHHNIIANSSFSWWGAWLNQNKDKLIISPKRWFFDDEIDKQAKGIVPEAWIKI